jgi:hypothetical protein
VKIRLGNSHDAIDPVHDEKAVLDPSPDRADGNVKTLRHLGNSEKLNRFVPMWFFPAHRSSPYSEVERTGLPIFDSAKLSRSGGA